MDREQVYALLIKAGHSPQKALEISFDWQRGDTLAKLWVKGIAVLVALKENKDAPI